MVQKQLQPFSAEYAQSMQTLGQNEIPQKDDPLSVYGENLLSVGEDIEPKVVNVYGQSKPSRVVVRGTVLP